MKFRKPVALCSVFLISPVLVVAEITVDLDGGGDFTEIQPAIDAAMEGEVVLVKRGEYVISSPINFSGNSITVLAEDGPEVTAIRMSDPDDPERGCVVFFENQEDENSVLEGFTLTGGSGLQTGGGTPASAAPLRRSSIATSRRILPRVAGVELIASIPRRS